MIVNEESTLFYNLSPKAMLALVKRQNLLQPTLNDCVIGRDDSVNLDDFVMTEVERWYSELLLTGDVELLPVEDVKDEVILSVQSDGSVVASVPSRVVRPVEVRLATWQRSVTRFLRRDDPRLALQHNPYLRGISACPAVVDLGDRWQLYGSSSGDNRLKTARAVVRPASGNFVFHKSITLPKVLV